MKYRIEQDIDPLDPREHFDHLGTMVCFHKRYSLGDKHDFTARGTPGDLKKDIINRHGPCIILPLYLYDHGGLVISTTDPGCPWDSGLLGYIFVSKKRVRAEWNWGRITHFREVEVYDRLQAEVDEYNQYLSGDVWGYIIEDHKGEEIDSCWGFYGREDCEQEAKEMLDHLEAEKAKQPPSMVPAPVCAVV